MTATTLTSLPFCARLSGVAFPAHIVRRIAAAAKVPARWTDRFGRRVIAAPDNWSASETERVGRVLAAAMRQQAPRYQCPDNGRLADWQSFRAMARRAGCSDMVRTFEIWTTPMSWRQKCAAIRGEQ